MSDDKHVPGTSKYKPEYVEQARELREKGYTLNMIAQELDVRRKTLYEWRHQHDEFRKAIEEADIDEDQIGAPLGAPTKYRPEFCERVIEMGTEGKSFAEMARDLDVDRETLYAWRDRHPRFGNALVRAREASLAWWTARLREGVGEGSSFNDRAAKFAMTNMFPDDWRDTRSVNVSGSMVSLDGQTLRQLPAPLLQRIADGEDAETVLASVAGEVLGALTAGDVEEADYEIVEEDDGDA